MPLHLDVQYAMSNDALSSRGISRRNLAEAKNQLIRVEAEFSDAIDLGVIPIFNDVEEKTKRAVELSNKLNEFDKVLIIGEVSTIRSLQVCVASNDKIQWIDSLQAELLAEIKSEDNSLLIALCGPKWVYHLANLAAEYCSEIIQCFGDGTNHQQNLIIEGAEIIEEAGIADMRFAMFSSLGLSLQSNIESACRVYKEELSALRKTGMWENPSSLLACCLYSLDTSSNPTQLLLVGARGSWKKWIEWGGQIWSGMASQVYTYGQITKRIDGRVYSFIVGDELGMNVIGTSSSNSIICLFEEQQPLIEKASKFTYDIWEMSNSLSNKLIEYSQKNAMPICICEVNKMNGENLLALCAGWIHSVLILNALRGADPLAMWGADQWRLFDTKPVV